jgi:hypothetical protein
MGLLDLLHSKLELFRLEQRYTKRRHRRSTFVSDAVYVDGEYVYASSNTTGSSSRSAQSSQSEQSRGGAVAFASDDGAGAAQQERRQQRRWSGNWGMKGREEKRRSMAPVHEVRWEDERR